MITRMQGGPLASITTVARAAGVSIATVSRVLNHSKPVSAGTRRRVEDAVAQLGYRVDPTARSRRQPDSRLLMVLLPDLASVRCAEILRSVASVAGGRGCRLLLADASSGLDDGEHLPIDAVHNRMVDGVLDLAPVRRRPEIAEAMKAVPWVSCADVLPESGLAGVGIDNARAVMDAVQYLVNRGHRQIAFIGPNDAGTCARQRRAGFARALECAGLPCDPAFIRDAAGTGCAHGQAAAGALLAAERLPTAVLAESDMLAIGAIKAFRRAGLRVPQDIAVMGFENLPIADVFEPGLTTIGQPLQALGRAAAELLLERITGGLPRSVTLAHTLVIRDSA